MRKIVMLLTTCLAATPAWAQPQLPAFPVVSMEYFWRTCLASDPMQDDARFLFSSAYISGHVDALIMMAQVADEPPPLCANAATLPEFVELVLDRIMLTGRERDAAPAVAAAVLGALQCP